MIVAELIAELQKMPPGAQVTHLWDGTPRTAIECLWLARNGEVVTSDFGMVCYRDEHRPINAPSAENDPYWESCAEPLQN